MRYDATSDSSSDRSQLGVGHPDGVSNFSAVWEKTHVLISVSHMDKVKIISNLIWSCDLY